LIDDEFVAIANVFARPAGIARAIGVSRGCFRGERGNGQTGQGEKKSEGDFHRFVRWFGGIGIDS